MEVYTHCVGELCDVFRRGVLDADHVLNVYVQAACLLTGAMCRIMYTSRV